jgi:processive 1,2-diacylglycerol beta-glucosyltransferase
MTKRILILSASVGSGHVRAADALARAFRAYPGVEVFCDDALEHTNLIFKELNASLYAVLAEIAPNFLGWWYERTNDPWSSDRVQRAFELLNTGPLVAYVKDLRPDCIVCTHFTPAGAVAHLLSKGQLDTQLGVVVTDFHFHANWIMRAFHWYFVAQEEDRVHGEALGFPADRVHVTGIPIDPDFARPVNREEVLARYRLSPDRPLLLVSGGALGLGPAGSVVKRLLDLGEGVQAVVVCGKNEKLKQEVEEAVAGRTESFRVLGYTTEMRDLMGAADLLVSKPGGLTTAEALACGLPMCILDPIGGQEEHNADVLLENGAAIKCVEITLLAYKVGKLLADRPRLQRMRDNARRLGRPDAAAAVARVVLEEPGLPPKIITYEEGERLRRLVREQ